MRWKCGSRNSRNLCIGARLLAIFADYDLQTLFTPSDVILVLAVDMQPNCAKYGVQNDL